MPSARTCGAGMSLGWGQDPSLPCVPSPAHAASTWRVPVRGLQATSHPTSPPTLTLTLTLHSCQAVPQPRACVCPDSSIPDLWGLKCQQCLIREGGGAGAGREREDSRQKTLGGPGKAPFSSCWGLKRTQQASPAAPQSSPRAQRRSRLGTPGQIQPAGEQGWRALRTRTRGRQEGQQA